MMRVSIILPTYNQEIAIKKTVNNLNRNFRNAEIIVVANGCNDNTVNIVKSLQKRLTNLKLLEFNRKLGKGKAIIEGFKAANGNIIGFVDADDAFETKGIKNLIDLIKQDRYDFVVASKWKGVGFFDVLEPFFKKIASRMWNRLIRILFKLNFDDTQGGAKFMKKEVFEKLEKYIYCTGFETDVELLLKASKKGYSIKEVYIPSSRSKESTFNLIYSLPMLLNILKLRFMKV